MNSFRNYFLGLLSGIILCVMILLLADFLDIHLIPSSSMSEEVWRKAKVVEKYIDSYYWKEGVSDKKMSEYAAKGIVAALDDKYSVYYTDEEYEETMSGVEGDYAGIGITVEQEPETDRKIIRAVQKGKPGDKAGLKPGDEIRSVNGTDVRTIPLSEAVSKIRGEEGKTSVLGIARQQDGKEITLIVNVTAEKIVNQSVTYRMLESAIGYVRISSFDNETTAQFEEAVKQLEKKKQKGMIVDVRNNGGGSLGAVISILDYLLPEGKLITEKSRGKEDVEYSSTDEKHFDKPIVVLVNQNSASASEVFAGTLQDREAASLVGVKTFGKGIVQTIYSLQDSCGGGIKLTTGEYFLPSGRSIHEKGLTPDVECEYTGSEDSLGEEDDNQLKKAIEVITSSMT